MAEQMPDLTHLDNPRASSRFTETVRSSAVGVVIEKMVFNRDSWLRKSLPMPGPEAQTRLADLLDQVGILSGLAGSVGEDVDKVAPAVLDAAMRVSATRMRSSG